MADDNIIAFNKETIEDLRTKKVLRETEETIDLSPVAIGEKVVGTLNDFERPLFVECVLLDAELRELSRELQARSHEQLADAVRRSADPSKLIDNLNKDILFPTAEDAEEYYSILTRVELLRALFNASLRERFGHSVILGVRLGFQVARVRLKYDTAANLKAAHGLS
jgi:hypothetical protein